MYSYIHSPVSLLGIPPRSRKHIAPTDSESHGCGLLYKAGRQALRHSVTVQLNVRMGVLRGIIGGAGGAGSPDSV
jgi:hypothetical protein